MKERRSSPEKPTLGKIEPYCLRYNTNNEKCCQFLNVKCNDTPTDYYKHHLNIFYNDYLV